MKRILFTCAFFGSFLTSLTAQTTVLSEDFQQGIPSNWAVVINDAGTVDPSVSEFAPGWIALPDPQNPSDTVAGATSFFTTPVQSDRWLISPPITLGAYGNILKWEARSHDPSFPDGYIVVISTTDSLIASFTDTLKAVYPEDEFWTQHEVNLSDSGYMSQTVRVAFVLRTTDAFKLYLDDISMRIDDPVGIEELAQLNTVVYPNPSSKTIAFRGDQPERVVIYAATGSLVYDQQVNAGQNIDISALENGSYIIELRNTKGISRQRFIKH